MHSLVLPSSLRGLSLRSSISFPFSRTASLLLLPSYSIVLATPITTLSVAQPRFSLLAPRSTRLLHSLSNPPDTGQAGGHVNTSPANRAPDDVTRVGSSYTELWERSRGRKGVFVEFGGSSATD